MYYKGKSLRQGGLTNYLMPFLIIICIGIIVVLIFNLWKAITDDDVKKAAYMHIVQGNAKMKTWGTEDFFNISTDALIMQGDEIITNSDAKIIVEFFDGTIMRLDGGTDVNFVQIDEESDPLKVDVLLVDGKAWFNKLYRDTGATEISVRTSNLEVISKNKSIFEVESMMDEVVRVFGGGGSSVDVDVYDADGEKVVETETVGVGQEIVFGDAVLEKYWQFQSPSVISAVSDELKATDWYVWNTTEDKAPTTFERSVDGNQFVKVEPSAVTPDASVPTEGESVSGENADVVPVAPEGVESSSTGGTTEGQASSIVLPKPTVTSVGGVTTVDSNGYYVISKNPAVLTGGVSGDVVSVSVNGYILKKFKVGDKTWSYFANADYGLMKEGENSYEVYTIDANGNKSSSITVKVMYKPETPATESPADSVDEDSAVTG